MRMVSPAKRLHPLLRTFDALEYYARVSLVVVWGFLLSLLFTPLAVAFWGNTTLSWAFARALSWGGLALLGIRVKVEGRENLPASPAVYLGNHQSNFDILVMGRVYPRHTVVIGKKELRKVPLFGTFFAATGNILIDRSDKQQSITGLDEAVAALRERRENIWVFPEGTRQRGRGLGTFKKGAFHMAVEAGVPVVPVLASSLENVLDVENRSVLGGRLVIRILPPIPTEGLAAADVEPLRKRAEDTFRAELRRLDGDQRA
jgi:1-acyl-sn-glycerol-3-phosphate acyltransferase